MITGRVLGPVEILVDGDPAPPELLWRKHLALLVYLARSPRLTRTREHLVGVLWSDKSESAARHSLSEALRVLRRSLGDAAIDASANQVRLADRIVELDVERLEELAARGAVAEAAALVAGDFLEGFGIADAPSFEEWLAAERGIWRDRSIGVLLRHAEALLGAGRAADAAEAARRAVRLDPLSAPASRGLMRSLAVGGDRNGALAEFERIQAATREQLATDVDLQTRDLAERIRAERSFRPLPAKQATHLVPRRAPMVAREAELTALTACWRRVQDSSRAAFALVEGDAGIGKSRLVDEFLARVRLDGGSTTGLRGVDGDAALTGNGLLGVARGGLAKASGVATARPAAIATLAAAVPEWADQFGPGSSDGGLAVPAALAEVVGAAARERPIAIWVDDAHWIDGASLLAFPGLLRDLAELPVLVLMTQAPEYRRDEIDALRAGADRTAAVRLKPLPPAELRRLCEWALPGYSAIELERVARRVGADSAGLPFLATELLHAIASGFDLGTQSAVWPAPLRTLDHTLPGGLPDTVVAAIRLSFRRLSRVAQQVAIAAALGPPRVGRESLVTACELEPDVIDAGLDELEWQRWLESDARGYSFVAGVARRVVASDMVTPGQRRRVEGRYQGGA